MASVRKRWQPSGFAARLRKLREEQGLSQAQLAERANCFPLTISKLERGVQEPAWPLVLALANALSVSLEAFRPDGTEKSETPPEGSSSRGRPRKTTSPGGETTEPAPQEAEPQSKGKGKQKPAGEKPQGQRRKKSQG